MCFFVVLNELNKKNKPNELVINIALSLPFVFFPQSVNSVYEKLSPYIYSSNALLRLTIRVLIPAMMKGATHVFN